MCLGNRPRGSEKVYYHGDNGSLECVDWIHGWSEAGTSCSHGGSRLLCWEPRSKLEIPDNIRTCLNSGTASGVSIKHATMSRPTSG